MKNQKGFELVEVLVIVAILSVIIVPIVFALTGFQLSVAKGEHTGYITAVETSGMIWQTHKAYIKTDVQSSQEEVYCVLDASLLPVLKEKQENKEKVTISFSHDHLVPLWECDGSEESIITSVK